MSTTKCYLSLESWYITIPVKATQVPLVALRNSKSLLLRWIFDVPAAKPKVLGSNFNVYTYKLWGLERLIQTARNHLTYSGIHWVCWNYWD
jgi:hypothetical protein